MFQGNIPGVSKQYPVEEKVLFNKEVKFIKWNKECDKNVPNVLVTCTDGSMYSTDHILLTCSLGVLKEKSTKLFSPALPLKKQLCIEVSLVHHF
mgnify:FL=1